MNEVCLQNIPHLGVTSYFIKEKNSTYNKLNNYLKLLYDEYQVNKNDSDFIYMKLQNIDFNQNTDWHNDTEKDIEIIKQFQSSQISKWKSIWCKDDVYWSNFGFTDIYDSSYNNSEHIKVYVTLKNLQIKNIFIKSIQYLLNEGKFSFSTKISKVSRNDQICYWVHKNEYNILKNFYKDYSEQLITPMAFIFYKNGLGISHEMNINSQNSKTSTIIKQYFKSISNIDDISLSDMYSLYVFNWNNKNSESTPLSFQANYADEILIILSTIELILNINSEQNRTFLLSDSTKLWSALASSSNWNQLLDKLENKKDEL